MLMVKEGLCDWPATFLKLQSSTVIIGSRVKSTWACVGEALEVEEMGKVLAKKEEQQRGEVSASLHL